ncbi:MAG: DNA translocase FtsK [Chloroflexi bacterium]|nr:DNA translocase FtsK [Chloroflexota bacterium]MBI5829826.1 DNA translocase FtsK [Chloroflexota bacterium]
MANHSAPTRELMEFQSDRIEAVLASHRIPVRVHGGTVAPRWIRFHFTAAPTAKVSSIRNLSEEIALALGAADARITRQGDMLAIEIPRTDEHVPTVRLLPMLRNLLATAPLPPATACLGLSDDGRPLLLRLSSPDVAHVLVAGATGSGKTELMRAILISLAATNRQSRLQMALIDPKARGLAPLGVLPHVLAPPATHMQAAVDLLERLVAEMARRDAQGVSAPRIVIAVDEVIDLLMMGGKPVEAMLGRLAQRGREAGMHLLLGAQKPSSALLGPHLKANLPARLVGRVSSAEDARVACGIAASGAEKLTGRGDFLAVAEGSTTHFQAAHVPPADFNEFRAAFRNPVALLSTDS